MFRPLSSRVALLAAAVAVTGGPAGSSRADLLTNGGFEAPALPDGTWTGFKAGSVDLPGWSVLSNPASNDLMLLTNSYTEPTHGVTFNAHGGGQSLDITGIGNTNPGNGISQTVATAVGQLYALQFWLGHATSNNGVPIYDPSIAASVDVVVTGVNGGNPVGYANAGVISGGVDWKPVTILFTATSASTTVTFLCTTPIGTNYAGLDDITLNAVPEPGPLALGAAGLPLCLGLTWLRRKWFR